MPPQPNLRAEDSKKHCNPVETGDIATVNGEIGWVVTRNEGTRRLPPLTIIETPDGYRYHVESDKQLTVHRRVFRPASEIRSPECPECGHRDLRVDWDRVGEPGRSQRVPLIRCNTCEEDGEHRHAGLIGRSRVENVQALITEEVVGNAQR